MCSTDASIPQNNVVLSDNHQYNDALVSRITQLRQDTRWDSSSDLEISKEKQMDPGFFDQDVSWTTSRSTSNYYKQKIFDLETDCCARLNKIRSKFMESLQAFEDTLDLAELCYEQKELHIAGCQGKLDETNFQTLHENSEKEEKILTCVYKPPNRSKSLIVNKVQNNRCRNICSGRYSDSNICGLIYRSTELHHKPSQIFDLTDCISDFTMSNCYSTLFDPSDLSTLEATITFADGNFEVTLATKATIYHQGLVEWKPPAIYKSSCEIDVEYFPFDEQTCVLKFGSWTYDGFKVDLRHMDEKTGSNVVDVGVDLSEFYMSVEWDILEVPAVRNEKFYTCCDEPYLDITFNITMRRKTLFYTVNIIIPCMGISFLTVLTFYLPSDSGEKVTLSISILISLHVFFLLVVEIIPPTSLVVPLLGKYLIFAMILVSISICVTVVVLNVHFRSPQTHKMAPWVKRVFIHILPRLLIMRRPQYKFDANRYSSGRVLMRTVRGKEKTCYYPYRPGSLEESDEHLTPGRFHSRPVSKEDLSPSSLTDGARFGGSCLIHDPPLPPLPLHRECEDLSISAEPAIEEVKSPVLRHPPAFSHSRCPPEIHRSCICVRFIAEHTKMLEDSTKVKEDWKYVAMVLDRLFLWIFTLAVLVGTAGIILQAPTLYDDRVPIDKEFSEFATTTVVRCPPQQ